MLKPETIQMLHEAIPNIDAIYVFGSRASGAATPTSDLDIAVYTGTSVSTVDLWWLAQRVALIEGCDVDLVDLKRASTVLQYQIITTGTLIEVNNQLQTDLYEIFILRSYAELQRVRAPLLEDIKRRGSVYG